MSEPNDAGVGGGGGEARSHVNDVKLGVADSLLGEEEHIKA
jgi:hypothetical protein